MARPGRPIPRNDIQCLLHWHKPAIGRDSPLTTISGEGPFLPLNSLPGPAKISGNAFPRRRSQWGYLGRLHS